MAIVGIIGGSGLYQIDGVRNAEEIKIKTPFGAPSDSLIKGELEGNQVVFLPRHGRGHRITPTDLNYRANIYALKELGVTSIISVSAVGSLRPDYAPTDMIIIDQFFDRTNQARTNTFFGEGIVAHIQFAQPLCPKLRDVLYKAGKAVNTPVKMGGTYLNMEGPAFSTLAESETYRKWGMDVIGMTQMNEARLAREAEICYATLAMVTDYDCWYEAETGTTVSVELVIENLNQNVENAKKVLKEAVKNMNNTTTTCTCCDALNGAILTDKALWPQATINKLGPVLKKYV